MSSKLTSAVAILGSTFAVSLANVAVAETDANPFGTDAAPAAYLAEEHAGEGKCGEGKCGAEGEKKDHAEEGAAH